MNKHLLYGCGIVVNFGKLTTLSSALSAAVTWSLRHVTARCSHNTPGFPMHASWKVLEFSRLWCWRQAQWCRCRCQNLQKLTHIYLYIRKNRWWSGLCPGPHSNCCLSLYLNMAGIWQGPGKMLLGSWKVLEIFLTKRVGTLTWLPCKTVKTFYLMRMLGHQSA